MSEEIVEEKKKRGFALLSKEKLEEISRKGGRVSQEKHPQNRFTTETAKIAAMKVENKHLFDSVTGRAASLKKKEKRQ